MEENKKYEKQGVRFQTGLWKKNTKIGAILSGSFEDQEVVVFNNRSPERGETDPAAFLKIAPKGHKDPETGKWVNSEGGLMVNLYRRKSKAGVEYMGGVRGESKYHIYTNTKKMNERQPDFQLMVYMVEKTVVNNGSKVEGEVPANGGAPDEIELPDDQDPWDIEPSQEIF